ncbi:MAG: sulfate adenylyltransferase [Caldiserica bacterium]|nr:sulfate adenylyltransferase [Caldisericota bacterium]
MNLLKLVIVGHIDHGKSTLIGQLLHQTRSLPVDRMKEIEYAAKNSGREMEFAHLLDYLEEEREQGISIDTTQVFFKTEKRDYLVIDAPGHVEFVKNMVTGASQAEAAVLIVDVTEGMKEQSKRHAYLLSLLGIGQVIVALNKMDLVGYEKEPHEKVKKEVAIFLSSIGIRALYYIPISAIKGENITRRSEKMPWYAGPTFIESLDKLKEKASLIDRPLVFPVQDTYRIRNKRIAVGKLLSGIIEKGQEIKILPLRQITRVESVEKYQEKRNVAYPGESIGITLPESVPISRGDIICLPGKEPVLADRFEANIFWLHGKELKIEKALNIRCATQETTCKVGTIKKRIDSSTLEIIQENTDRLKNLEVAEVVIKTKTPLVLQSFPELQELGRFVLEMEGNICAGGIVTNAGGGMKINPHSV